jgi:hypothetical protein
LATLWFSERAINGRENDLSSITYDVAHWTDVELLVKDKKASIKINSQEAFSTTYKQSLQKITGLSFISNGLCEVEHVTLLGLDGKEVYKDNFDR